MLEEAIRGASFDVIANCRSISPRLLLTIFDVEWRTFSVRLPLCIRLVAIRDGIEISFAGRAIVLDVEGHISVAGIASLQQRQHMAS